MFSKIVCTAAVLLTFADSIFAANAATWRSHSIYQVITDRFARADGSTTAPCDTSQRLYCGGSWQGLINKLDYIQGMGFTAVWISPITENLPQNTAYGYAYHGYWQQRIYEINTNFGSVDDLKALSSALHSRKMLLMVDVVVNHNGFDGAGTAVDYSVFSPFNHQSYYHNFCEISNYNNQTNVEDCWLGDNNVALADLRTEDADVANEYYTWIGQMISNYSIDGLRIDTVKHVDMSFWGPFNKAAGVFCTGEVLEGDPNYVCPYQNSLDSLLNYPIFFPLTAAFQSTGGNMGNLVNEINQVKSTCKDSTLLGSFVENQDNPRFPSLTGDISLAKNVIAFTLLADGVPILYNGQEQHYAGGNDPANREAIWLSGYNTRAPLYIHVAALNQVRNQAIYKSADYLTYQNYPIYSDSSTIAMRKGANGNQIITVLTNLGSNGATYSLSLGNTGYSAGEDLVEVLSCQSITVDGNGNVPVSMGGGLPKIFYPTAQITGSGICGH